MKNRILSLMFIGFCSIYVMTALQYVGTPEAVAVTQSVEVANTTATVSVMVACSSYPTAPTRVDPFFVQNTTGVLPGRFAIEIWNDDPVMDVCLAFSTSSFAGVRMNLSVTSATYCRRLTAKSAITYNISSKIPVFCVSSAGYSLTTGLSPGVVYTQFK